MRVTQSMLSSNMLRNLNTSYGKMSKLQDMLNSGKKVNRPSDDPVVVVKGMNYRTDIDRIEQFQRNIGEANTWLDTTDEALSQVGEALKRVQELTVQAATDSNTSEDRKKMQAEIDQIKLQIRDVANTKVGSDYIFTGTHTNEPLYKNGTLNAAVTATGGERSFLLNVFDGISINVNTPAREMYEEIDKYMGELSNLLGSGATSEQIGAKLGDGQSTGIAKLQDRVLTTRASVGARQNRVEMMDNRLEIQFINVTKQKSANEDTEYAETITDMTMHESIHQAALSVGSKIVQQTLVDFIR